MDLIFPLIFAPLLVWALCVVFGWMSEASGGDMLGGDDGSGGDD